MDKIWLIIEPALTPALVGAIAITLATTHTVKILAEHWYRQATESARRWRAFCATVSLAAGMTVGIAAAIATSLPWWAAPVVAVGTGPAWLIAKRYAPQRIRGALMTATDRQYSGKGEG